MRRYLSPLLIFLSSACIVFALTSPWASNTSYTPRVMCVQYEKFVIYTSSLADLVIAFSYFGITAGLVYVRTTVMRRLLADFGIRANLLIFVYFAAFIFSCGLSHLVECWMFWYPTYRISALVKLVTALASLSTLAVLAIEVMPFLHRHFDSLSAAPDYEDRREDE